MTKDDMDLLKGFPLSIEQKERLLELIGNNNGGSENNNEVLKIELSDESFQINGIIFRVDPFSVNNDTMYVFSVGSKELYKYAIANNIKSAIVTVTLDEGMYKREFNSVSYIHEHIQEYEYVGEAIGFVFVNFDNYEVWIVRIGNYD